MTGVPVTLLRDLLRLCCLLCAAWRLPPKCQYGEVSRSSLLFPYTCSENK